MSKILQKWRLSRPFQVELAKYPFNSFSQSFIYTYLVTRFPISHIRSVKLFVCEPALFLQVNPWHASCMVWTQTGVKSQESLHWIEPHSLHSPECFLLHASGSILFCLGPWNNRHSESDLSVTVRWVGPDWGTANPNASFHIKSCKTWLKFTCSWFIPVPVLTCPSLGSGGLLVQLTSRFGTLFMLVLQPCGCCPELTVTLK